VHTSLNALSKDKHKTAIQIMPTRKQTKQKKIQELAKPEIAKQFHYYAQLKSDKVVICFDYTLEVRLPS
jgi:hypothetical protein